MVSWVSIALSTTALTCVTRFPRAPKINGGKEQDIEVVCLIAFDSEFLWTNVQAGTATS